MNWGLGHASRCVPIIEAFLAQNARVILASDGAALDLLRAEFPQLETYVLPAYNIRYPFNSMVLSIALQLPKILRGCLGEYFFLKKMARRQKIDIVVSDNRFGFFHPKIHSVFITHQVNLLIGNKLLERIATAINHFFIKKFDALWIPDFADAPNLAGTLSHGENWRWKTPPQYLGCLSRFSNTPRAQVEVDVQKYRAIFVLSGPEPQRTFFEEKIVTQLRTLTTENAGGDAHFALVRGSREAALLGDVPNTDIFPFLTAAQLRALFNESEMVICRSGYSSVMDLVALGKKAVLIPTPGQTEQEYLAKNLLEAGIFYSQTQANFDLTVALKTGKNYAGWGKMPLAQESLTEIVSELMKK